MNYQEIITFITRTDIQFDFDEVVSACEAISEIDFTTIPKEDYPNIEGFFNAAFVTRIIPEEYEQDIEKFLSKLKA